jgi:hypothetical protein
MFVGQSSDIATGQSRYIYESVRQKFGWRHLQKMQGAAVLQDPVPSSFAITGHL